MGWYRQAAPSHIERRRVCDRDRVHRTQEIAMNILDAIINDNNGAAVMQLGSQFGLEQNQATAALAVLVPALAAGVQKNLQTDAGSESLMSALSSGNHSQYFEKPGYLAGAEAVADGNGILSHVLGSKNASRDVATRAAEQTGLSPDVLKRMLPLAATLMMGALARRPKTSSISPAGPAGVAGIASMLTPLLDRNRDGSIVDDVTGMVGGFMKR